MLTVKRTIFLKIIAIVAMAEFFVMFLLKIVHVPEGIVENVTDALLLSLLSAPFLYFFVVRSYQELAEKLVTLMNNIPGVVFRGHRDWSVSFMGAGVEQITGYTAEEYTGGVARWKERIHPSDLDSLKRVFRETVQAKKKEIRVEYRTLHKDGSFRWVADRRQFVYDEQGEFRHVDGILFDITDRKRAEEALEAARRKAEEEKSKTEAVIAAIGDGISIQDRHFRVLYQNEVHKGIIGDHLGKFCYEAYEKKDHVCEGCPVAMAFRDGEIHTVERRVEAEGGMKVVEITSSALRDASGEIVAGIEAVRDITARRRTEEDRSRLAMAVEQSAEAIVVTDREGTILYVNPAFETITGYSVEEAVGKNPRICY
jgi:PAS domain S-box-containing protein